MGATVRPYQFTGLPKYSKAQFAVSQSLALLLASKAFQKGFTGTIESTLSEVLKVPCRVAAQPIRPMTMAEVERTVPTPGCLVLVGAAPSEHKILVDVDPSLALMALDRLLGGEGNRGRLKRPFTDIEQGVVSYALLKVMRLFGPGLNGEAGLSLSLDRIGASMPELREGLGEPDGYQCLGFTLECEEQAAYARILVPNGLLTERFGADIPQNGGGEQALERTRRLVASMGSQTVVGRVEMATVDLAPEDLRQVEAGDIVVLENHQMHYSAADGVNGRVMVRVGTGCNGGFAGQVISDVGGCKLEVAEIVVQEQPTEVAMSDTDVDVAADEEISQADEAPAEMGAEDSEVAEAAAAPAPAEPADNLEETEGLLRDVPAPVVVELGRLKLNTAQVTRLRAGQILRLPRGPHDPVNLVVGGKVFAHGELVDVDGELGVRLTDIVGG